MMIIFFVVVPIHKVSPFDLECAQKDSCSCTENLVPLDPTIQNPEMYGSDFCSTDPNSVMPTCCSFENLRYYCKMKAVGDNTNDCFIQCKGDNTCQYMNLLCPEGVNCRLNCKGQGSCYGSKLYVYESFKDEPNNDRILRFNANFVKEIDDFGSNPHVAPPPKITIGFLNGIQTKTGDVGNDNFYSDETRRKYQYWKGGWSTGTEEKDEIDRRKARYITQSTRLAKINPGSDVPSNIMVAGSKGGFTIDSPKYGTSPLEFTVSTENKCTVHNINGWSKQFKLKCKDQLATDVATQKRIKMRYYDVCLHYRNKHNTGYTEGTSNLQVFGDADGCTSMYSFFYYDTWNKELKTLKKDEEVCLTFDNSGNEIKLMGCGYDYTEWLYNFRTGQLRCRASSAGTYYCLTRESDSEGLKMANCKEEYENGIDKQSWYIGGPESLVKVTINSATTDEPIFTLPYKVYCPFNKNGVYSSTTTATPITTTVQTTTTPITTTVQTTTMPITTTEQATTTSITTTEQATTTTTEFPTTTVATDALCSNNPVCDNLGLTGKCCPTIDDVTLDCCGTTTTSSTTEQPIIITTTTTVINQDNVRKCSSGLIEFPIDSNTNEKEIVVYESESLSSMAFATADVYIYPKCKNDLQFNCHSKNANEVQITEIDEIIESHQQISNPIVSADYKVKVKYNISIIGVKDNTNGDGVTSTIVNCSTNYHFFNLFDVSNNDILLPYFDFDKLQEETKTFLFAGETFTILASKRLNGPVFFPNKTHVYLNSHRVLNEKLNINANGRILQIGVPSKTQLCDSPEMVECDVTLRVINYNYIDNSNKLMPVSDEKTVHYIRNPCHNNPECEAVVDNYRDYPSASCPVGFAGNCKECPRGARCPGGERIWALPGFASIVEPSIAPDGEKISNVRIVACAVPAERCLGFVKSEEKEVCAVGYGGPKCGGCQGGYYSKPVGSRECQNCPKRNSSLPTVILLALTYLFGILIIVFIVITLVSYLVLKRNGGTLKEGISRAKEFMIYVCISVALLSQVSRASLGKLPKYMDYFATFLAVFQMDVSGPISPDCINEPFWRETTLFQISIVTIAFLSISMSKRLRLKYCRRCRNTINKARHGTAFWLCISYPLVTNLVVKICHCIPIVEGQDTTHVLAVNSLVTCYVGKHKLPFILGLMVGVLHVVLFPIVSLLTIFYVRRKYVSSWDSKVSNFFDGRPMWKYFLQNSYLPQWFWVRQMELGILFISTLCNQIFAERDVFAYLIIYMLLLCISTFAYFKTRPFVEEERWKLPVRVYTFFCTACYAITNYLSSNLVLDPDKEFTRLLLQFMSTTTMILSLILFIILIVCYIKTLIDSAKVGKKKKDDRKKYSVQYSQNPMMSEISTLEIQTVELGSAIEMSKIDATFSDNINIDGEGRIQKHDEMEDVLKEEEKLKVEVTTTKKDKQKQQNMKEPKKIGGGRRKKKSNRRNIKPPPNTKVMGTWWQLVDDSGRPYYYNQREEITQWEKPDGWVKFMATERFNHPSPKHIHQTMANEGNK